MLQCVCVCLFVCMRVGVYVVAVWRRTNERACDFLVPEVLVIPPLHISWLTPFGPRTSRLSLSGSRAWKVKAELCAGKKTGRKKKGNCAQNAAAAAAVCVVRHAMIRTIPKKGFVASESKRRLIQRCVERFRKEKLELIRALRLQEGVSPDAIHTSVRHVSLAPRCLVLQSGLTGSDACAGVVVWCSVGRQVATGLSEIYRMEVKDRSLFDEADGPCDIELTAEEYFDMMSKIESEIHDEACADGARPVPKGDEEWSRDGVCVRVCGVVVQRKPWSGPVRRRQRCRTTYQMTSR